MPEAVSSVRGREAAAAEAALAAALLGSLAASASTIARVDSMRESRMRCFCRASQRRAATGSPARWMIASWPARIGTSGARRLELGLDDAGREARRRARAARECGDGVAAREQRGDQGPADEAGR